MGKLAFGLIAVAFVSLVIFGVGFMVGGSFGTGSAQEFQLETINACLPIDTTAQLQQCLVESEAN